MWDTYFSRLALSCWREIRLFVNHFGPSHALQIFICVDDRTPSLHKFMWLAEKGNWMFRNRWIVAGENRTSSQMAEIVERFDSWIVELNFQLWHYSRERKFSHLHQRQRCEWKEEWDGRASFRVRMEDSICQRERNQGAGVKKEDQCPKLVQWNCRNHYCDRVTVITFAICVVMGSVHRYNCRRAIIVIITLSDRSSGLATAKREEPIFIFISCSNGFSLTFLPIECPGLV